MVHGADDGPRRRDGLWWPSVEAGSHRTEASRPAGLRTPAHRFAGAGPQAIASELHDGVSQTLVVIRRIAQEYEAFTQTLNDWAKLKEQEIQAKKASVAEKIQQMDHKLKVDFQLVEQRLGHHHNTLKILDAQC